MITLDRGHLEATAHAAVVQDEALRVWGREIAAGAGGGGADGAGSVAELVQSLRALGHYWDRVQAGRFRTVKRALARLMQPFFKAQIRYNLTVAEHLGRVEVALEELRQALAEVGPPGPRPPARP